MAEVTWGGIASISESVLCLKEPHETKAVFAGIVREALATLTDQLGCVPFVQAGANDGIHADHLHPLVISGRWRGILIEPAPLPYARLLDTYRDVEGLILLQIAVSDQEESLPFYYVEGDDGLSSLSLDTIRRHAPKYQDLEGMIRPITVEARRLDAICDDHGLRRPAVIAVDTEGMDDVVLKSFPIEARRPAVILFEHCHLSAERSAALRDRLIRANYRILHDRHDALALRRDVFEQKLVECFIDRLAATRPTA